MSVCDRRAPRRSLTLSHSDGMSEFAWADQWATEKLSKAPSTSSTAAAPNSFNFEPTPGHSLRLLIASLARLRSTLAPITLLTQWAFRPTTVTRYSTTTAETRGGQGLPFYGHHLPTSSGWPSIDRSARGVTTAADPLAPPSTIPGTTLPSFALDYHVTCYPPTPTMMRRGTTMVEAFERRREGRGEGTAGFKCVLREKGGREVGMWEWEVTSEGGVIA